MAVEWDPLNDRIVDTVYMVADLPSAQFMHTFIPASTQHKVTGPR
jgi:hypothetical protein